MIDDIKKSTGASEYLRGLGQQALDDKQLDTFLVHLMTEEDEPGTQAAFEHLLRVVDLTSNQAQTLINSDVVKRSVGLQHSLLLYVRAKSYRAAEDSAEEESNWRYAMSLLSIVPLLPS